MEKNYNDHSGEENFLFGKDKKNPFVVPEGYFNSLTERIMKKAEIAHELEEFKNLASIDKKPLFDVPARYFSNSENRLEHSYELSAFEKISTHSKKLPEVNADYFASLENRIRDRYEKEEELKAFSVLSSIPKKNNFEVAADYFDTAPASVKEKHHHEKEQRKPVVVQLWKALSNPRMAIAASIVLIFGISAIWYATRPDPIVAPDGPCKTLACLEKNELINEHNDRDFDEDNLYEMVDVESLDKQLSDSTAVITTDSSLNESKK